MYMMRIENSCLGEPRQIRRKTVSLTGRRTRPPPIDRRCEKILG
jgi:hypothetical protein